MFNEKRKELRKNLSEMYAPVPGKIAGEWYDKNYYENPGTKSNWPTPYVWNNFAPMFAQAAAFVMAGFPFAESFLDVGCARGFMMRALIEHAEKNERKIEIYGFDHSPWAVENAEEKAKKFIECSGIDEFEFKLHFDVMLSFDVFEHLTPEQAFGFLTRSKPFVNDAALAVIKLEGDPEDVELSHINLRNREHWHSAFMDAGWFQNDYAKKMQDHAMREIFVKTRKWEVFYYQSGKKGVLNV